MLISGLEQQINSNRNLFQIDKMVCQKLQVQNNY